MNTRRLRTRRGLVALLTAVSLVASLGVVSVQAVHDAGLFELDTTGTAPNVLGDANTVDATGGGDDWATLYAGGGSAFASTFIPDKVSSAEDSFYTGGGSKDVRDIPDWAYATTNDVVPDKDDLADAFAAAYIDPNDDDHTILYFGVDRYDNNGDAETGFWFFKDTVELDGNGGFTGEHSLGDVLVIANWGGSNPVGEFTVYEWVGGKNPLALVFDSFQADCAVTGSNDNACAVVNRTTDDPPWDFIDKSGSEVIRPLELFEAGIDLNFLFGDDVCFASFLASTRSSHSPTAQLKDFALGQFEQCGAAITIGNDAVNEVTDEHTFTVHVTQSTGGSSEPVQGVFPEVTLTATNGAIVTDLDDQCASVGTDASGDCTVTFTSNSAGVITAHAAVDVTIGTDTFSVETDGEAPNSGDAVKRFVDAGIVLSPLTATNEVNDEHEITATVTQDDGLASGGDGVDGFGDAPDGTLVIFSPVGANTAGATFSNNENTCTTVGGECSVFINTSTPGDVDIHATTTFDVGGISLTRASDGTGNNSGDANKVYVDAYITIEADATNPVGEPHTFTVTVFKNVGDGGPYVAAAGEHVDFTLTDGGTAVSVLDAANSTCDDAGANTDAGGQCTITFVSDTPGTVTGHATVTLSIGGVSVTRETDGLGNNSDDAVKTFITGAIRILKDSTKGGPVAQAGAVFSVDGSLLADDFEVIDNGANDSDPDVGEICVGGVTPGDSYTVNELTAPTGYGDATQTDVVITAVSGTCATATFGEANTATFVNPPLFDIQVNYRDGGSGETSLVGTITCDNPTGDDSTTDATGWDDTLTVSGIEVPVSGEITLNCTLVVDP